MITLQSAYNCSRPFWELISAEGIFTWLMCPYTIGGLGLAGLGLFIVGLPFIGLKNWSESWELPLVWLAIMVPTLAVGFLPGGVLRRIAGLVTAAFAVLFLGLYFWWGRS